MTMAAAGRVPEHLESMGELRTGRTIIAIVVCAGLLTFAALAARQSTRSTAGLAQDRDDTTAKVRELEAKLALVEGKLASQQTPVGTPLVQRAVLTGAPEEVEPLQGGKQREAAELALPPVERSKMLLQQ